MLLALATGTMSRVMGSLSASLEGTRARGQDLGSHILGRFWWENVVLCALHTAEPHLVTGRAWG